MQNISNTKTFDYSKFPHIVVNLPTINNEQIFKYITSEFESFYSYNKDFTLELETIHIDNVPIVYLYKFGNFLKKLKKRFPPLLQHTTIHIYNDYIYYLINILFNTICKPLAEVKILYWNGDYTDVPKKDRVLKKELIIRP